MESERGPRVSGRSGPPCGACGCRSAPPCGAVVDPICSTGIQIEMVLAAAAELLDGADEQEIEGPAT